MKRRDFLRNTGWFVVGASLVGIPACGDDNHTAPPDGMPDGNPPPYETPPIDPPGKYSFPQGVASGDPRATSVVLWTRAVVTAAANASDAVALMIQVSTDQDFTTTVVAKVLSATQASDHTVRVLVTDLAPATTYYYRFTAGVDTIVGRTRTAPAATADVQVNLAWMSCQDYTAGHYGAYRQLIVDDEARPAADKIHAIVHLGDMIYETGDNQFQTALDDNFEPIQLKNRDGSDRKVGAFPSGGGTRAGVTFAETVDDYRHLYKTFFSDADIQAARALWPFISIWDDHEFTDDCWQSQANYTNVTGLDEGDQTRRISASQAWFEYTPAQLTGSVGVAGVSNEAKDFSAATVVDAMFTAPNADNFVPEPNNVAAVGAIAIYRSFRFGKHVELVMTDERSYRSDHAIPEDLTNNAVFFAPRGVLPLPLVNTLDAGATFEGGAPPNVTFTVPGSPDIVFPNARHDSPAGTMLGKQQKAWWKATMKQSDATWKLWGNEVTLMRLKIQQLGPTDVSDRVVTGDSWDGYASERNELMTYLRTEDIKNVVVLTGDVHAAFAGTVMDNFDAPGVQTPVACELVGPGVTSNSLYSVFEFSTRPPVPVSLRSLIVVDASANEGTKFTENLNMLLLHGTTAAGTFAGAIAQGASQTMAINAASNVFANPNPHLQYVDSNAQGYGYVKITADQVTASINTINRPIAAASDTPPGIKRTANVTIPKDNPAGMVTTVTGTKPFPLT
jgi:alkaline phosphatase D